MFRFHFIHSVPSNSVFPRLFSSFFNFFKLHSSTLGLVEIRLHNLLWFAFFVIILLKIRINIITTPNNMCRTWKCGVAASVHPLRKMYMGLSVKYGKTRNSCLLSVETLNGSRHLLFWSLGTLNLVLSLAFMILT